MTTPYQPSIAPIGAEPQPTRPAQAERTEHLSLDGARAAFLQTRPEFASTHVLDELRATEYGRLDSARHVYLDYTGGGLYACSQVNQHMELLCSEVFGNPHSSNPTSLAMTRLVEQARAYVLEFFNALPDEYVAVFTQNASGALKLVGESYPFEAGDQYLLTFDNHNSVNGIREFARAQGAGVTYAPVLPPDMRLADDKLDGFLDLARPGGNNLFAYPAQSNFAGVQHSFAWIERAHAKGWDVLLDAAAYVPTSRLDLNRWQRDFCVMSLYRIFGYPTGIGCLLARKAALAKLHRPWFAGGTITFNLYDPQGHFIDHRLLEYHANQVNISLRSGCFYNPGGGELALGISSEELSDCLRTRDRLTLGEFRRCIDDKSTSAVRVSVGLVSTFEDAYRFVQFVSSFVDKPAHLHI